jgi:hypothetical protein
MTLVRTGLIVVAMAAAFEQTAQAPRLSPAAAATFPGDVPEIAVKGTIDRFDVREQRLVLQTKDGRLTFVLDTDALIWFGSRHVAPGHIASDHGRRAKVRYTQAAGTRTAHWVFISSESPRGTV